RPGMTRRWWARRVKNAPLPTLRRETEITRDHTVIAGDVRRRSIQDKFTELHHISAVGDLQGGLGVLLDQQPRDAGGAQFANGAENVGDDDRRKPKARLVQHQ